MNYGGMLWRSMDEPVFRAEKTPGSWRRIIGQDYWVAPDGLGPLRGKNDCKHTFHLF